jgi:hypothetical protein
MKARITQSCALPGKATDCKFGTFVGLHGRFYRPSWSKTYLKLLGLPLGSVTGNFNLNVMLKIKIQKNKKLLMGTYRTSRAFILALERLITRPLKKNSYAGYLLLGIAPSS